MSWHQQDSFHLRWHYLTNLKWCKEKEKKISNHVLYTSKIQQFHGPKRRLNSIRITDSNGQKINNSKLSIEQSKFVSTNDVPMTFVQLHIARLFEVCPKDIRPNDACSIDLY